MDASLRHPYHPSHALVQRKLSENCDVCCSLCRLDLRGMTYCCLDCNVFLHESCAMLPIELWHPSHPEHALALSVSSMECFHRCDGCCEYHPKDSAVYCCDQCEFSLDIACVVSTLNSSTLNSPEGHRDDEMIQHFAHDHPLSFFDLNALNKFICKACKKPISGRTYGCNRCFFRLHKSCAQLPREMPKHPAHEAGHVLILATDPKQVYRCVACYESHEFAYCCKEFKVILDVKCATLILSLRDQGEDDSVMIRHTSHHHQLTYFHVDMKTDLLCKGCHINISGETYGCPECIFFLHKSCAEMPQKMIHSLHPHALCLDVDIRRPKPRCHFCHRMPIIFTYSCHDCSFYLDLECIRKTNAALEGVASAKIIDYIDKNPMSLGYYSGSSDSRCIACQQPVQGMAYTYFFLGEKFGIHVRCAKLPRTLEHLCHPKHPLTLIGMPSKAHPKASEKLYSCSACNRESAGCAFFCAECEFYLDIDCAFREPSLKHQLHEHSLVYIQRAQYLKCSHCGYACNTDLYRCNFNLHYDCIPLQPSGKHELHGHTLFLRDRVINDTFEEQYCDLCEEPRNPDHGVYYCEICNCAAHIYCVFPKVEPMTRKSAHETLLSKLDEEIADLEEKAEEIKRKLEALKMKQANMRSSLTPSYEGFEKEEEDEEDEDEEDEDPEANKMKLPRYPSDIYASLMKAKSQQVEGQNILNLMK